MRKLIQTLAIVALFAVPAEAGVAHATAKAVKVTAVASAKATRAVAKGVAKSAVAIAKAVK